MLYKMDADQGQIMLDHTVIAQLVQEQLEPFRGKVWVANSKGAMSGVGSFLNRLSGRDNLDDFDIWAENGGLYVRVYLIIRFGISIRSITEALIQSIRRSLEEYTEISVNEVSIVVTGTLSKHIARRNIEIKG